MDQNTLITLLGTTGAMIFSMLGMFIWARTEANNDRRQMQAIQREDRKDILEMKDFHNRLCIIEERRTK